jgi:hypothetical protein
MGPLGFSSGSNGGWIVTLDHEDQLLNELPNAAQPEVEGHQI